MAGKSVKYTRRHFQDVAETIKAMPTKAKKEEWAMKWGHKFALDNPRFDWMRFMKACGL